MDTNQQVRCAQMDLLIEIKRICEKHNINFCLVAGSLLGAIRHDGFIPWDDDIDIGMLRVDYDKFFIACRKDLSPDYQLSGELEDDSALLFAKLRIKGTHYVEAISKDTKVDNGIFLDVFPFDNVPHGKLQRKIQATVIYLMKKILLLRCGYQIKSANKCKNALYTLLERLSNIKDTDSWKKTCKALMVRYNSIDCEFVTAMGGSYSYKKEMKAKSMFEHTTTHVFEGISVNIPVNYDVFLTSLYGDYMKLPPLEQREGKHEISTVDFGVYGIKHINLVEHEVAL